MSEEFDYGTHWLSKQVDSGLFGITHPAAVGVLKFALIWDIIAICYTVILWRDISTSFLFASAIGLSWVNIAPYLIWYYDKRVLSDFFIHLSELISDDKTRHELAEKYNRLFADHHPSVYVFWAGAAMIIVYVSEPVLRSQGMIGVGSVFLWTTYAYAAYIGGVLGHGFVGPMTTILLIREITKHELEIDPLHPDNLGGLSTVGYCSIRTTLLYSTGSLFLPLLFYLSSTGERPTIVFAIASIYVLTILSSFIYPTVIVNRRAQDYRDGILEDLRHQYANLEQEISSSGQDELNELNKRLELQRVQRKYESYNSLRLYPLQIEILTRLAGSILLPILFIFIEFYLPNLI